MGARCHGRTGRFNDLYFVGLSPRQRGVLAGAYIVNHVVRAVAAVNRTSFFPAEAGAIFQ
jgi:hypothetical protein